MGKKKNY